MVWCRESTCLPHLKVIIRLVPRSNHISVSRKTFRPHIICNSKIFWLHPQVIMELLLNSWRCDAAGKQSCKVKYYLIIKHNRDRLRAFLTQLTWKLCSFALRSLFRKYVLLFVITLSNILNLCCMRLLYLNAELRPPSSFSISLGFGVHLVSPSKISLKHPSPTRSACLPVE